MLKKLLPILSVSLVFVGVAHGVERTETHSWWVGDAPIVKIETFKGSIRVEPAKSGQLELTLEAQARGRNASLWLDRINVKATPFGAGIVVTADQTGLGVDFTIDRLPLRRVNLVLRVPQSCILDLKSEFGNIEVADNFRGKTRARVHTGDIFVGRIEGSVNAVTQSGNVIISRTTGDVTARSYFGDLHVGSILGQAILRADHGNIDVVHSTGSLKAEAVMGDITAGMSREILGDAHLEASVGDVFVDIDPDSALEVQARSSWGKVASGVEFEVKGKSSKSRLNGVLNGGGALLALRAKVGNVHIKSVPTYGF